MRAGALRERVTFQAKGARVADGGGGGPQPWEDQFTVWGRLNPTGAREDREAGRLAASADFVLTVRKSADTDSITEGWRAVVDGVPYQIRSKVDTSERGRLWEMIVQRGVAT
ncbi:MAG: hypothetical protein C0605_08000 [Hyphomicrobiales bacterium]|nr:MAG: hypothetical protein C0605_08000 [Hyphomicrobiales bacterium]